MAQYSIVYAQLQNLEASFTNMSSSLQNMENSLTSVIGAIDTREQAMALLRNQMQVCKNTIAPFVTHIAACGKALNTAYTSYRNAEIRTYNSISEASTSAATQSTANTSSNEAIIQNAKNINFGQFNYAATFINEENSFWNALLMWGGDMTRQVKELISGQNDTVEYMKDALMVILSTMLGTGGSSDISDMMSTGTDYLSALGDLTGDDNISNFSDTLSKLLKLGDQGRQAAEALAGKYIQNVQCLNTLQDS